VDTRVPAVCFIAARASRALGAPARHPARHNRKGGDILSAIGGVRQTTAAVLRTCTFRISSWPQPSEWTMRRVRNALGTLCSKPEPQCRRSASHGHRWSPMRQPVRCSTTRRPAIEKGCTRAPEGNLCAACIELWLTLTSQGSSLLLVLSPLKHTSPLLPSRPTWSHDFHRVAPSANPSSHVA
jgi:hypothetical protein